MDLELLTQRARVFRQIRAFFDKRRYLEVDTPLLAPDLIPETCLEVFETTYLAPAGSKSRKNQPYWLIPSPEIWMKKLIAGHRVSLYQICKCFRNGESLGRLHSPEFTMLEYYTMDADYEDSLGITEALFETLLGDPELFSGGMAEPDSFRELRPPFTRITVGEAFSRWAGFELYEAVRQGTLEKEARKLGLDPPRDLEEGALYDLIFIHRVEPALPRDRPVVLLDYPAFVPCLAQKKANAAGNAVERWELYVRGIELANCYSEEGESETVRRYFEREGALKRRNALVPHRVDGEYWKTFLPQGETGTPFPRCSGVAMGLDRLIMALAGKSTINGVLPFPME
ncbi:MAG: LysR family transcriptional regulator [Spirochaetaceae bacterium]|jgi:lysyl-tRNA synthetase class 2|nr:LysR family transcriptional regulator [Spirochaetaceae bacterium]